MAAREQPQPVGRTGSAKTTCSRTAMYSLCARGCWSRMPQAGEDVDGGSR